MGAGSLSPRSIAIFWQPLTLLPLTPKPTSLVSHGGSKVMIVQSNISPVPHAVLIHWMLSSTLPVVFPHRTLYIRRARGVIHDYINVTFSHILFPFPENFLLVSLIIDITSSTLATIPMDSQSQIRSTSIVRPSNKTTKCVLAKKVSWNYDKTVTLINILKDVQVVYPAHTLDYCKLI